MVISNILIICVMGIKLGRRVFKKIEMTVGWTAWVAVTPGGLARGCNPGKTDTARALPPCTEVMCGGFARGSWEKGLARGLVAITTRVTRGCGSRA